MIVERQCLSKLAEQLPDVQQSMLQPQHVVCFRKAYEASSYDPCAEMAHAGEIPDKG